MTTAITNAEKVRKLPWAIATDTATNVYAQLTFFGSVFVLFLDQLNFSKAQIGFLLSLMTFFGMIALFVAPAAARYGYKRTFVTFWLLRKSSTILLFFTPFIAARFDFQITLMYVAGVIILFAVCRSVAITAYFPWIQEFVPSTVQGKFTATKNIYMTLAGLIAVAGAGYFVEQRPGLGSYMWLFAIGTGFGLISVWAATKIPGGAPQPVTEQKKRPNYFEALKDSDFVRYLFGAGLITLVTVPLTSFLPLFMQEQVGLSSGNTILLQTGTMIGGMTSTYFWGWAADRYGSKPIVLSGISLLIALPLFWMLMPRNSSASLYFALAIAFFQGIANMGWAIGSNRLLFVSVVPVAQKVVYMAVYYAAMDVTSGFSKIIGGQVIERTANLSGNILGFTLDPYTPLFLFGIVAPLVSLYLLRQVRSDTNTTLGEFTGLFLQGNPYTAIRSLIAYHRSPEEEAAVSATEYLGQARSALTVDELLASLEDPRFNVRFETIISIARTRPDPRLTEALIKVLNGTELSLTVVAAWALGRIGDAEAIPALSERLESDYRSVRAHSARALATLGDTSHIDILLEKLREADDKGLQMAYASALGKLGVAEAINDIFQVLDTMTNQGAQMELALSIARLVGGENRFIRLLRQINDDTALAISQLTLSLRRRVSKRTPDGKALQQLISQCADTFARNDMVAGVALLQTLIAQINPADLSDTGHIILQTCSRQLTQYDGDRLEYLVLALHTLNVDWKTS